MPCSRARRASEPGGPGGDRRDGDRGPARGTVAARGARRGGRRSRRMRGSRDAGVRPRRPRSSVTSWRGWRSRNRSSRSGELSSTGAHSRHSARRPRAESTWRVWLTTRPRRKTQAQSSNWRRPPAIVRPRRARIARPRRCTRRSATPNCSSQARERISCDASRTSATSLTGSKTPSRHSRPRPRATGARRHPPRGRHHAAALEHPLVPGESR